MRPIDADKVLGILKELDTRSFSGSIRIKNAMCLINEQPTVYDVDKVVEQLEELKSEKDIGSHKVMIREAIDIVKGSGIDGN